MDRRRFVRAVGAAGAAGFAGAMGRARASADGPVARAVQASGQTPPGAATDFAQPANLRAGAQLDSRFPVSFAEPVAKSFQLVTEYFSALSQRNLEGCRARCTSRSRSTKRSSRSSSTAPRI
jgi:hypothetical protein